MTTVPARVTSAATRVTAATARVTLCAAVLMFLAVFGMTALTIWHGASVNDDDAVHAVSVNHLHGGTTPADPDGAIHVAAHVAGQGLATSSAAVPSPRRQALDADWPKMKAADLLAQHPAAILRPPRS